MHLKIIHNTKYRYKKPVKFDIHYLRFYPLNRPHIQLNNFEIKVDPEPTGLSPRLDMENNYCHQLWMNEERIREFSVDVEINLEIQTFNPFDFLLDPDEPLSNTHNYYPDEQLPLLQPYMNGVLDEPEMKKFVDEVQDESDNNLVRFLSNLIIYIYQFWTQEHKEGDFELNSKKCFDSKSGSCKELAWMLMVMLRSKGLAVRFVSGYAFNPLFGEGHELHAWVEILLPGAGWVGLDPSSGLFTNKYYIPVATSYDPSNTMPVTGFYRGNSPSKLDTSVSISVSGKDEN